MFKLIKVSGDSMSPALEDGDIVVTVKTKPQAIGLGLIYVIDHSDLGRIIKRLKSQDGERFMLSGDNPNSTPSAVIGPVAAQRINRRAWLAIGTNGLRRL
jgi:phage repressor protein C with HTH and peptisase S24 domain